MVFIKIGIDILCGALNALGGWHFLWMRRYIMPVFLAITFSFVTHIWWIGLLTLPTIGTLCLGYKDFVFLGNTVGRGLWLACQALVIAFGVCITDHLSLFFYLPYVVVAFGLGAWLYRIEQVIGDIIFGIWLGSIVFFVR